MTNVSRRLAFVLSFALPAFAPAVRAEKKVLRVGVGSPVMSLDPAQTSGSGVMLCTQVYEAPYEMRPGALVAEPHLFATPLRSDGPLVRSAPIRPGAVFSDGTPVTAALAASSLSRVKWLAAKASVRAEGDRVVFTLKQADSLSEGFLSLYFCGVALEKGGKFIGSGPYVVSPSATPSAMVLVRNPHYPRPAPIDEVRFQVYRPLSDGSLTALVNAIKRHDVDFTNFISPSEVAELKAVPGVVTSVTPGKGIGALFFNLERPGPLQEKSVRLAVAHAIDRADLARHFYSGDASLAAKSPLPSALAPAENDGIAFDPAMARKLLASSKSAAAGPVSLTLLEPNTGRALCAYLADALGKVGFRVNVVPGGGAEVFGERMRRGDFEMVLSGLNAGTPEPVDFLEALAASWSIPSARNPCSVCLNLSRYRNKAVDAAFGEYHEKRRPELLKSVLRAVGEDVPFFPLVNAANVTVHSGRLKGFRPTTLPSFSDFDLTRQ